MQTADINITSPTEQDYVENEIMVGFEGDVYVGGLQEPCTPEPDCGWAWITGEPWVYTNWSSRGAGEPDDRNCLEGALAISGLPCQVGEWKDVDGSLALSVALIVEYE